MKLLEQEDIKNTLKMATPIFQTIDKYVGPTKLLEMDPSNAKYNSEKRLYERCIDTDLDDKTEIEKSMATADNNKDNNKEDP